MIAIVEVGVALSRPPKVDRLSKVVVSVPTKSNGSDLTSAETEAVLTATLMAHRADVVMITFARIVELLEV